MASKYDQKTKDEVIAFIKKHNEDNGRGGQSAAVKKWKLNSVTVKSWLEKAGVDTPGRGGKKKRKPGRPPKVVTEDKPRLKPGRKPGFKPGPKPAVAAVGDLAGMLNRLLAIRNEIASLESEYGNLKTKL